MTYLVYVAVFGALAVIFLWLRDARIYYRTGFSGYRQASYRGVVYGALATFGVACAMFMPELLGLGLVLAALFLQAKINREKFWGNEGALERLFGSVPRQKANKK
jgi:hypothetical protein